MKTFRYAARKHWFKGNTHLHSTASDGAKTFAEIAAMYASTGHDFLFRTDHWVASNVASDREEYPLLWLDGVELDGLDHKGTPYHVVCLGRVEGISRADGLVAGLRAAREQGALLVLAHPHWCGNTTDEVVRWGFDAVEVYNHECHWLNGKGDGLPHWDYALLANGNTVAIASDDAHLKPEHLSWNRGWIMVNADACTPGMIIEAIRRGDCYASCGPEILSITWDGASVHVSMSPVRYARVVGQQARGVRRGSPDGDLLTEVTLPVPDDWAYAYLELEDDAGRRAWTNNLFVADSPE